MKSKLVNFAFGFIFLLISSNPIVALSNSQTAIGNQRVIATAFANQDKQVSCSGALVEPRLVFLAGHCTARMLDSKVVRPDQGGLAFSGEVPLNLNWVVYGPGVPVTPEGNSIKANVIGQFLAPEFKSGGNGRGPVCDFAVIVLDKPLAQISYNIVNSNSLSFLRKNEYETESLGYGYKSYQDIRNSMTKTGRDPNPALTKSFLRSRNLSDGSELLEVCEGKTNENLIVHVRLPNGVFAGSSDSGGPLWIYLNNEWQYIGAVSGSVGLGIGPGIAEDSPNWKDQNLLNNSGISYVTAQAFTNTIKSAREFLAQQELIEAKAKAEAEAKAKAEAEAKAKAEAEAKAKAVQSTKRKTIICFRNSSKKIITGINPKCPKGFQQKKN